MSSKAEEFISDKEIRECLDYAEKNKNNRELIDQILNKARKMKGISHKEAIVLLDCELEDKNEEIYQLAKEIKQEFYGNRIVMFAPLYLSNYCINGCRVLPISRKEQAYSQKKTDAGGDPRLRLLLYRIWDISVWHSKQAKIQRTIRSSIFWKVSRQSTVFTIKMEIFAASTSISRQQLSKNTVC